MSAATRSGRGARGGGDIVAGVDDGRSLDELLAAESDEGSARGLKRSLLRHAALALRLAAS